MEKSKNIVFGSTVDEALFTALTPLSVRIDVFPVVYGPEEDEIFRDFLEIAEPWGLIRGAGKDVFENPNEYGGLFNPNDGEAFFRVADGEEKRTVYFQTTSGGTGLAVKVLNSVDETSEIETIAVNYYVRGEEEDGEELFRTRVFFRTTGFKPGKDYETPRYFDLLYSPIGDETITEADYEARKEVDRIKEESEARKEELRRRLDPRTY